MVVLKEKPGVLYVGLRDVVECDEVRRLQRDGERCLTGAGIHAMVLDIRGCKPVDRDSCALLRSLLAAAKAGGVDHFYRIGEGTLFARQMLAVEQAAEIEVVMVLADARRLPLDPSRLGKPIGASAPQ